MADTTLQTALLSLNERWLRQALELLANLNERQFATSPPGLAPHRVGSHLRHIIEFYECFLDGLPLVHVDYDSRKRDLSLETSADAAARRIHHLIARLESTPELEFDNVLFIKAEDAGALHIGKPFMASSTSRELMMLSSHTIHHFALIAMTLAAHGVAIHPDFGVAPSTLRHREQQAGQPVADQHRTAEAA